MKYTRGQKLYYKGYTNEYIACIVETVLEKSNRYRIKYVDKSWNDITKMSVQLKQEKELFLSIDDCIASEINVYKEEIHRLKSKIGVLESKTYTVRDIKNE